MKVIMASGGSTSQAGVATEVELRRCEDGTVHVYDQGTLEPALPIVQDTLKDLPGTAIMRVSASAEKAKSGTTRVLLKVRLQVPITNVANASGNMTVTNQEISLHVVAAMPAAFVNALRGAYAVADNSYASPKEAAKAAVMTGIGALVAVLTNQTIDLTDLNADLTSLPIYQGMLGVCPLNEDTGEYGTSWPLPPTEG